MKNAWLNLSINGSQDTKLSHLSSILPILSYRRHVGRVDSIIENLVICSKIHLSVWSSLVKCYRKRLAPVSNQLSNDVCIDQCFCGLALPFLMLFSQK